MVMINNLVDAGSPAFGEDLIVRVRGTFIDIGLPMKRRSGSAPPRKGVFADEDPTCPNDSQYISEWIGRAMRLSDSRSDTQREALDEKCVKCEEVKRVDKLVNKTVNVEEDQKSISLVDAEAMPPPNGTGGDWKTKCDSFDFVLGSWRGDAAPDPQPTLESRLRLEVPGPCKRLNLSRNGPSKYSCHKWLEENILSKHPPQETPAAPEVTTLMICDIPCRQTIEQIIDVINHQGFANTFNLVYMPSKRPKYVQNMGYVFVNFKTAEFATAFGEAFQNFRFPNSLSKKVSSTKSAHHQGYTENVDRYIKQGAVGCLMTFDDAMHGGEGQKMCQ